MFIRILCKICGLETVFIVVEDAVDKKINNSIKNLHASWSSFWNFWILYTVNLLVCDLS